jgi:hypothetical protein
MSKNSMLAATALLLLSLSGLASAQPYTLDEELETFELTLRDYPGGNGVLWTSASGVAGAEIDRLYVGGLSSLRAVEVYVISLSETEPVALSLAQSYWNEDLKSCKTDSSGMCGVDFSTYGSVGFKVSAAEGTPWQLVVMTSPELPMESFLPTPLFEAKRADAARYENGASTPAAADNSAGGELNWLLIAVVALLAVIALLLVLMLRKRGAAAALAVMGLLVLAVPGEPAFGISESTSGTLDALGGELDRTQRRNEQQDGMRSRLENNTNTLLGRLKILMDLKKMIDEWNPLKACSHIAAPASTPRVPMFCEDDASCASCYSDARSEFNAVRGTFEQLRVIYQCSMDDINSAIAFGDSASGVHGVSGLAWQAQRARITNSVDGLKNAYDNKYDELRGRLHGSMVEIASCEAQYGEPDWYDRFGYVYFEFLADKYKRSD